MEKHQKPCETFTSNTIKILLYKRKLKFNKAKTRINYNCGLSKAILEITTRLIRKKVMNKYICN